MRFILILAISCLASIRALALNADEFSGLLPKDEMLTKMVPTLKPVVWELKPGLVAVVSNPLEDKKGAQSHLSVYSSSGTKHVLLDRIGFDFESPGAIDYFNFQIDNSKDIGIGVNPDIGVSIGVCSVYIFSLNSGTNRLALVQHIQDTAGCSRTYFRNQTPDTPASLSCLYRRMPGTQECYYWDGNKFSETSNEALLDYKLHSWMKSYPDLAEHDGAPLRMFLGLGPDWASSPKASGMLSDIKKNYPEFKLLPYIEYSLAKSTQDYSAIISKYPHRLFHAATDEFLTAWKHMPSQEIHVAALAQLRIAELTAAKGDAPKEQVLLEWQKVLSQYTTPLSGKDPSINYEEWRRIIMPAYFTIIDLHNQMGNNVEANAIADELLNLPDVVYGDNYERRVYPEVYLYKAEQMAKAKDYTAAEKYLKEIIYGYPSIGWGYHGGISGTYYRNAIELTTLLPSDNAMQFMSEISTGAFAQYRLSTENKAWTALMRAGRLSDAGRSTEAKALLKETYELYPRETLSLIRNGNSHSALDKYFQQEMGTELSKYFDTLQK